MLSSSSSFLPASPALPPPCSPLESSVASSSPSLSPSACDPSSAGPFPVSWRRSCLPPSLSPRGRFSALGGLVTLCLFFELFASQWIPLFVTHMSLLPRSQLWTCGRSGGSSVRYPCLEQERSPSSVGEALPVCKSYPRRPRRVNLFPLGIASHPLGLLAESIGRR